MATVLCPLRTALDRALPKVLEKFPRLVHKDFWPSESLGGDWRATLDGKRLMFCGVIGPEPGSVRRHAVAIFAFDNPGQPAQHVKVTENDIWACRLAVLRRRVDALRVRGDDHDTILEFLWPTEVEHCQVAFTSTGYMVRLHGRSKKVAQPISSQFVNFHPALDRG